MMWTGNFLRNFKCKCCNCINKIMINQFFFIFFEIRSSNSYVFSDKSAKSYSNYSCVFAFIIFDFLNYFYYFLKYYISRYFIFNLIFFRIDLLFFISFTFVTCFISFFFSSLFRFFYKNCIYWFLFFHGIYSISIFDCSKPSICLPNISLILGNRNKKKEFATNPMGKFLN
jgi:hypothetical protein